MKLYLKKMNRFILAFFICFMFIGSIKHISVYAEMTVNMTKDKSLWIIFGSLLLVISIFLFSKYVDQKPEKIKWVTRGLVLLLLLGEMIYLCFFNCLPTSDSAEIVNAAIELANGNSEYMAGREYFFTYSNNNLLTIVTSWIYGLCKIIFGETTNFICINNILNIIFLNFSIYFAYAIVRQLRGEKNACKVLFLLVLNPVQYMALSWYYSATISTFFSMGILYVVLVKRKNIVQRKIQIGLAGLLTGIGLLLRPTVCITSIAVMIIAGFLKKGQKEIKRFLGECLIGAIVCILSIFGLKCLINLYAPASDSNYPMTHWISMGLEGNGTNEAYGANYPKEISSHNEMIEYDLKRIKKNISDYTIISFGKHIAEKVFINWCDGSSALNVKMKSDIKFSKLYDYVVSQRADGWLIYCQAFRTILYLLIISALFRNWNKEIKEEDILWLNLFGAILFYLIWEVKSDYSIPFLPLFCCLASDGMDIKISNNRVKQSNVKKIVNGMIIITGILGIFLMEKNNRYYTQEKYMIKEPIAAMNSMKRLKVIENIGVEGKQLIQQIDIEKNFNHIKIYCKKTSGKGTYQIQLCSTSGESIQEWNHVSKKQIQYEQEKNTLQYDEGNKKGYLSLELSKQQEEGRYYLIISSENSKDSIRWYYSDYVYFDYYTGDLLVNNERQNGELAIYIENQQLQPYMSLIVYRILECAMILYVVVCLAGYHGIHLRKMFGMKS